jgi:uncharacterized protein
VKTPALLGILLASGAAAAGAQSNLVADALRQGQIGERYDGYMGFAANPSDELRRQVSAINLRRRNLYIELASRRNATAQVVGLTTGCELLANVQVGQAYMLSEGAWRRRAQGETVPLPNYCR